MSTSASSSDGRPITVSGKFDAYLDSLEGRLFAYPLIPSILAFIFSLSASIVVNVAEHGLCDDNVKAFVIGAIVIGYLLSLFYGVVLVGPEYPLRFVALGYFLWFLLMFSWNIYGSTAISGANSDCTDRSIYRTAMALMVMYWIGFGLVVLPFIVHACISLYRLCASLKKPDDAADADAGAAVGSAKNNNKRADPSPAPAPAPAPAAEQKQPEDSKEEEKKDGV